MDMCAAAEVTIVEVDEIIEGMLKPNEIQV